MTEDSLVDLRCSVLVVRDGLVLAIRRGTLGDWVLPGGRPHQGESMIACARREALEETGLEVHPGRCLFVLEVTDPKRRSRIVELVFQTSQGNPAAEPASREPDRYVEFVTLQRLRAERMHPPLAGYLAGVIGDGSAGGRPRAGGGSEPGAAYLGNLWRPTDYVSWDQP